MIILLLGKVLLNKTFANWTNGDRIANAMYILYLNDSAINPQRAYDRIVADYGLFCANIEVMYNALAPIGQRESNMYLYYDGKYKKKDKMRCSL
jgi:hypothetical protein